MPGLPLPARPAQHVATAAGVKVVVVFDSFMSGRVNDQREATNLTDKGLEIVYSAQTNADTFIWGEVSRRLEAGAPKARRAA